MNSIEREYQQAVDLDDISGAELAAQDVTGNFKFIKAFGNRTLLDGSKKPLETDDVVAIFSSTKLLTTIAILQCVENGLLALEDDVGAKLAEFKDIQVLKSFSDDGEPQYEAKDGPVTLRHLLTHSNGTKYDYTDPFLTKWRTSRGEKPSPGRTLESRGTVPLVFQPGTEWVYGLGVDWAGKLLERELNTTLEAYFEKHICAPLGIVDGSFWPQQSAALRARMADISPDDPRGAGRAGAMGIDMGESDDCLGGSGYYMSAPSFLRVLHSLLANDGRLLRTASVDEMFAPQLPAPAHADLNHMLQHTPEGVYYSQGLDLAARRDWGWGGMLLMDAQPGWMGARTLMWGGGANYLWFIDRETGLCAFGGPLMFVRDCPMGRADGSAPTPHREGARSYVAATGHFKQVFRKGIYDLYAAWKKEHA